MFSEVMDKHYTESRYYPLWTVIADRIARADVRSILDVGCGPGQVAQLLYDRGLKDYVGLDFSPQRIGRAREICPHYEFFVADAFQTDLFENGNYDCMLCMEFLEHVNRDTDIIQRVRPGTYFIGTVPNFDYTSHVRYFTSSEEVDDRYRAYFDNFHVAEILEDKHGKRYFLLEGIKR